MITQKFNEETRRLEMVNDPEQDSMSEKETTMMAITEDMKAVKWVMTVPELADAIVAGLDVEDVINLIPELIARRESVRELDEANQPN